MSLEQTIDVMYVALNRVRTQPLQEAGYYQQSRRFYNGLVYRDKVRTREGPNALQNLVTDLKERQHLTKRLKWSFALHMAADEQAIRLGDNGLITTENTRHHVQLPERCKQFGIVRGRLSEVYEFGGNSPQEILETLLIDDGLVSRKRRRTLLDPIYNYVGIGSSFHEKYGTVTVIILAEDIISLVSPGDEGNYLKRDTLPQGQTYTFDIEEERDNERRRIEHENSKYSSLYSRNNRSYDTYSDSNSSRHEHSRHNRHRENHIIRDEPMVDKRERHDSPPRQQHQNALRDHSNDSNSSKQKSKCEIF